MESVAVDASAIARIGEPQARIGLIIPSVNSLSEPQFNRFAPPTLGVHVTRARIAGAWRRPLDEMADEISLAAQLLADCGPDLIVFHCTDTSMAEGPDGEDRILDLIRQATSIEAVATSRLVLEALETLDIKRVVVISPYQNNDNVIRYLNTTGFEVAHDVALKLSPQQFAAVTPAQWCAVARDNDRADADGIFLSCTNTTQIEAVDAIEHALGKPVVNSNQAVLWGCVQRLRGSLGTVPAMTGLGRLMSY